MWITNIGIGAQKDIGSSISNPQTIFIVIEDINNACTSQTTLLLEVVDSPTLIAPSQLEMCDMTEITGPGDEIEPFDLESKTDEITGGDLNISVTYYETQARVVDSPLSLR